jgi:hypothetical protein
LNTGIFPLWWPIWRPHFKEIFAFSLVTCHLLLHQSKHIARLALIFALVSCSSTLFGQFRLKGTVFDSSRNYPLELVSVISSSGNGTSTDAFGNYEIEVSEKDSIWFSYLNKPTIKYPVAKINNSEHFDIALHVNIPVLKEVIVRPRNYRSDSLQNRIDYAKAFNFQRPNAETLTSIGPNGAGFDINEIIRAFQFRKNRSMAAFRERLLEQEREKHIDHKFNKALVRRLTGLTGDELDTFMALYRPTYEFVTLTPEYDFQLYIKKSYAEYLRRKNTSPKSF